MARHARPRPRPSLARRVNRPTRGKLGGLFLAAVGTVTLAVAGLATGGDRVTPASLAVGRPPVALADDPGRRGGPMDYAPAQPPVIVAAGEPVWDPGKGPVIVDGQPLPTRPAAPRPAAVAAPTPEPTPAAAAEPPLAAGAQQPTPDPLEEPVIGLPPVGPFPESDTKPVIDGPPPGEQPPPAVVDLLEDTPATADPEGETTP